MVREGRGDGMSGSAKVRKPSTMRLRRWRTGCGGGFGSDRGGASGSGSGGSRVAAAYGSGSDCGGAAGGGSSGARAAVVSVVAPQKGLLGPF